MVIRGGEILGNMDDWHGEMAAEDFKNFDWVMLDLEFDTEGTFSDRRLSREST